jgi:hypothetical protein
MVFIISFISFVKTTPLLGKKKPWGFPTVCYMVVSAQHHLTLFRGNEIRMMMMDDRIGHYFQFEGANV